MDTSVDQSQDIRINIIGTPFEKGKLFESMIQSILSKQGYSNFQPRSTRPGMELDLICTDNVTNKDIVVEAKAHQRPITTPELEKFHSKFVVLRQNKKIESGIFWSLSGINSSGKSWYNALSQREKRRLKIKGGTEFFNMLEDLEIIGSKSLVDDHLKSLVGKDFLERELVYFKNNWYYVQFFVNHNKNSFAILSASGKIVDNFTCRKIREQYPKLKNMELILLASRKQILEILLQKDELTIDEIIKELKEKQVDVQITIDELIEQKLLTAVDNNGKQKVMITRGLATFLTISHEFKRNSSVLMKSKYLQSSITPELMSFILQRFVIRPSKKQIETIGKIILISPSALEYCLRSTNVPDQVPFNQSVDNSSFVNKMSIVAFITQLCILILSDIGERKEVLGLQDTKALEAHINLKFATIDELYLGVDTKSTLMSMRASGPIAKGDAVTIANPEGFIEVSFLQRNLGQTKQAVKTLNDLLTNYKDQDGDWKKAAYVNLGLYYTNLDQFEDAKRFLLKATTLYPEVLEGWLNLGNVYVAQDDISNAENAFNKVLKGNPSNLKAQYGLCKVLFIKGETDSCTLKLKLILQKDKRFLNLLKQDRAFLEFRKCPQYHNLLKQSRTL